MKARAVSVRDMLAPPVVLVPIAATPAALFRVAYDGALPSLLVIGARGTRGICET